MSFISQNCLLFWLFFSRRISFHLDLILLCPDVAIISLIFLAWVVGWWSIACSSLCQRPRVRVWHAWIVACSPPPPPQPIHLIFPFCFLRQDTKCGGGLWSLSGGVRLLVPGFSLLLTVWLFFNSVLSRCFFVAALSPFYRRLFAGDDDDRHAHPPTTSSLT